ncbi:MULTISPECIES: efflux RND transporter permease subunit [unclassified Sphingopyxis]|uniref:efflux RND transporter permease subunit n=1 Tax=unclassified Sphingopyxis TaxID=2614943 RepID=UPI000730E47C|nr:MULTISPECIES: efflux RND transporter permease subunit [unclassified Sphingopyxis]KTE25149.1 transporter [Sphingopyxis sp. H057]KTE53719.1 transporter [Sphingopyxis sp. H073]KTE56310.1 transporter [Sphingopyxis sp. H071]KTE62004.1 transporter [Sphingopyxis sp. H107]KTE67276.1 transporter [Sphingopyxis sp. H100]
MSFRNISAWCIRNPVPPIVLFILLLLAGVVSFNRMDVNDNPDIEFPAVQVIVAQPGAAPSELETQVTQRVEAAVRSVSGVDEMSSYVSEGNSRTMVQFAIGTPIDRAYNDVNQAISQIRSDLPDGILEPQVVRVDIAGGPITYFAVETRDMTLEQLSWFVDNTVAKELLSIPGMSQVRRSGGVDREIRVILDPARMQSYGLTASQVNQQLRQVNVNAAGGRTEIAGSEQAVRVLGNAANAFQLGDTRISIGNGRTIRLSDVAKVTDGYAEQRNLAKIGGKQVLSFSIEKAKGSSDVTVHDETMKKLAEIKKNNPKVDFKILFTRTEYTKEQYRSSMAAMIEGAVLAVVVVFLFLRDWRATLISALAIPLSAIPTFWFMDMMGFSLNGLSLLALSLVAGVLVDDAIVEIENIVRHMRMGKTAYQAAIDAADEIGLAVVATTMSIVAVFLPVALMPGVSGQFFIQFGMTVVFAVLVSLAVARMITPMIAAYFLSAQGEQDHASGPWVDRYERILAWTLDNSKHQAKRATYALTSTRLIYLIVPLVVAGFVGLLQVATFFRPVPAGQDAPNAAIHFLLLTPLSIVGAYLAAGMLQIIIGAAAYALGVRQWAFTHWAKSIAQRTYARLFDHRVWIVGIGVAAFATSIFLFATLPQQFQPTINSDYSQVRWELPPGSTLAQSEHISNEINDILEADKTVENAFYDVNVGGGTVYITLKKKREQTSVDWERGLQPKMAAIPDARVSFQSQSGGFSGRDLTFVIGGDDPALLESHALKIVAEMSKLKELRSPRIEGDIPRPEIIVKPRLDLAAELGVTTSALSQTIRIATIGDIDQNAAKFSLSDRQIPIRVLLSEDSRRALATIENLPVPTSRGTTVPLKSVAEIGFGAGPTELRRYNQTRRIVIGADLAPGLVTGDAQKKIDALPAIKNMPQGVRKIIQGDAKWQAELINNFLIAVVSGLLLVFSTLVLLYRRFLSPLVNMSSLLLAPLGGLLGLLITGMEISMPVYIGLLMLLGIVAKNSILLVDFAIEEMDHGVGKMEALLDAGRKRAQPIVMTTVAMVAGMVPTALSLSGDGAWRAPMGVVVIGGLTLSTLLTLLIVPAGFSLADSIEKRLGRFFSRNLLTYRKGDDVKPHGAAAPEPAE